MTQKKYTVPDMGGIWTLLLDKVRIVFLISLGILFFGWGAYQAIPREVDPTVDIPAATITTVWPGASPSDVEQLVTNVIEKRIENLDNLDDYNSVSQSGVSVISVQFEVGVDKAQIMQKLRDKVDEASRELPDTLPDDPSVDEISISDQPILSLAISGDYAWSELKRFADRIEDELDSVSQVKRTEVSGAPKDEIHVFVDPFKLESFGLGLNDVIGSLQSQHIDLPLGTVQIDGESVEVSVKGKAQDAYELLDMPLFANGSTIVRLSDVASVRREFARFEVETYLYVDGEKQPSVGVDVIKSAAKGNAILMAEELLSRLDDLKASGDIPEDLNITEIYNRADEIQDSLSVLTDSGSQTLFLIALVMLFALGWKESLLASISIPLSMLIAVSFLYITGETFNGISLFALVLAVGLLVDNSIIIVEGLYSGIYEKGLTPREAAVDTIHTFRWPIVTGTLTTIFAFLPMLLFVTGVSGDYIAVIPNTVIAVLIAALFVSLLLLPAIGMVFYSRKSQKSELLCQTCEDSSSSRFTRLRRSLLGLPGISSLLRISGFAREEENKKDNFDQTLNHESGNPILRDYFSREKQSVEPESIPDHGSIWLYSLRDGYRKNSGMFFLKLVFWTLLAFVLLVLIDPSTSLLRFMGLVVLVVVLVIVQWLYQTMMGFLRGGYPGFMAMILKRGILNFFVILASLVAFGFSISLLTTKQVLVEVFPASDMPFFVGVVEMPKGTPIEDTAALVDDIKEAIDPFFKPQGEENDVWLDSVQFIVGQESGLVQNRGDIGGFAESHILGISFRLAESDVRVARSYEITPVVSQAIESVIPSYAEIRLEEQQAGPPTGAPIEVRLLGYDTQRLGQMSEAVKAGLENIEGLENVRDTLADTTLQYDWTFDRARMSYFGLTPRQVTQVLRSAINGVTAINITEGDQEIDVNVRIDWAGDQDWDIVRSLDFVQRIPLKTPTGGTIAFQEVATGEITAQMSRINHKEGTPIVRVRAELAKGLTADSIVKEIQAVLDEIEVLPGEIVELGGDNEESNRLLVEMGNAMLFALLLILVVLVWQFNSFSRSLLILWLIPLSLTGVFIGFWLTGRTITFPTMIGIVSLAGIIVNDAIVLMDQIIKNLNETKENLMEQKDVTYEDIRNANNHAMIEAGRERLQPIFLTSITTVVGMLPLSLSDEIWGGLGFAIVYGMAISTILTLILIPSYMRFFSDIKNWFKTKKQKILG